MKKNEALQLVEQYKQLVDMFVETLVSCPQTADVRLALMKARKMGHK